MKTIFYAVATWLLRAAFIVCVIWSVVEFVLFIATEGDNPFNWLSIIWAAVSFFCFWLAFVLFSWSLGKDNYQEYKSTRGPRTQSNFEQRLEEMRAKREHEFTGKP